MRLADPGKTLVPARLDVAAPVAETILHASLRERVAESVDDPALGEPADLSAPPRGLQPRSNSAVQFVHENARPRLGTPGCGERLERLVLESSRKLLLGITLRRRWTSIVGKPVDFSEAHLSFETSEKWTNTKQIGWTRSLPKRTRILCGILPQSYLRLSICGITKMSPGTLAYNMKTMRLFGTTLHLRYTVYV